MCSTQWETPVMPGVSLRAPTPYQTQKVVIGALCISRVRIFRPFGRTVSRVCPPPLAEVLLLTGCSSREIAQCPIGAGLDRRRSLPAGIVARAVCVWVPSCYDSVKSAQLARAPTPTDGIAGRMGRVGEMPG